MTEQEFERLDELMESMAIGTYNKKTQGKELQELYLKWIDMNIAEAEEKIEMFKALRVVVSVLYQEEVE